MTVQAEAYVSPPSYVLPSLNDNSFIDASPYSLITSHLQSQQSGTTPQQQRRLSAQLASDSRSNSQPPNPSHTAPTPPVPNSTSTPFPAYPPSQQKKQQQQQQPRKHPNMPVQKEICIECMMRDRDLADVDVLSPGVWDRESDVLFYQLLRQEDDDEAAATAAALNTNNSNNNSTSTTTADINPDSSLSASSPIVHPHSSSLSISQDPALRHALPPSAYGSSTLRSRTRHRSSSSSHSVSSSAPSHPWSSALKNRSPRKIGRGLPLSETNLRTWTTVASASASYRYHVIHTWVTEQRRILENEGYPPDFDPTPPVHDYPEAKPNPSVTPHHSRSDPRAIQSASANFERRRFSRIHANLPPLPLQKEKSSTIPAPTPHSYAPPSSVVKNRRFSSPIIPHLGRKGNAGHSLVGLDYSQPYRNQQHPSPYLEAEVAAEAEAASNDQRHHPSLPPRSSSTTALTTSASFQPFSSSSPPPPTRPRSFWGRRSSNFLRSSPSASAISLANSGSMLDMHLGIDSDRQNMINSARASAAYPAPPRTYEIYDTSSYSTEDLRRRSRVDIAPQDTPDGRKKKKSSSGAGNSKAGKGIKNLLSKFNLRSSHHHAFATKTEEEDDLAFDHIISREENDLDEPLAPPPPLSVLVGQSSSPQSHRRNTSSAAYTSSAPSSPSPTTSAPYAKFPSPSSAAFGGASPREINATSPGTMSSSLDSSPAMDQYYQQNLQQQQQQKFPKNRRNSSIYQPSISDNRRVSISGSKPASPELPLSSSKQQQQQQRAACDMHKTLPPIPPSELFEDALSGTPAAMDVAYSSNNTSSSGEAMLRQQSQQSQPPSLGQSHPPPSRPVSAAWTDISEKQDSRSVRKWVGGVVGGGIARVTRTSNDKKQSLYVDPVQLVAHRSETDLIYPPPSPSLHKEAANSVYGYDDESHHNSSNNNNNNINNCNDNDSGRHRRRRRGRTISSTNLKTRSKIFSFDFFKRVTSSKPPSNPSTDDFCRQRHLYRQGVASNGGDNYHQSQDAVISVGSLTDGDTQTYDWNTPLTPPPPFAMRIDGNYHNYSLPNNNTAAEATASITTTNNTRSSTASLGARTFTTSSSSLASPTDFINIHNNNNNNNNSVASLNNNFNPIISSSDHHYQQHHEESLLRGAALEREKYDSQRRFNDNN